MNKSESVCVCLSVCLYVCMFKKKLYIVAQQLKQVQLFTLLHNNYNSGSQFP
jgi:hypothetical protein